MDLNGSGLSVHRPSFRNQLMKKRLSRKRRHRCIWRNDRKRFGNNFWPNFASPTCHTLPFDPIPRSLASLFFSDEMVATVVLQHMPTSIARTSCLLFFFFFNYFHPLPEIGSFSLPPSFIYTSPPLHTSIGARSSCCGVDLSPGVSFARFFPHFWPFLLLNRHYRPKQMSTALHVQIKATHFLSSFKQKHLQHFQTLTADEQTIPVERRQFDWVWKIDCITEIGQNRFSAHDCSGQVWVITEGHRVKIFLYVCGCKVNFT